MNLMSIVNFSNGDEEEVDVIEIFEVLFPLRLGHLVVANDTREEFFTLDSDLSNFCRNPQTYVWVHSYNKEIFSI